MRHFCRALNATYQLKYVTISFGEYGSISVLNRIFIRYSVSSCQIFVRFGCALRKRNLVYKQNSASIEFHQSQESLELALVYSCYIYM